MAEVESRLRRWAPVIVAGVIPTLLVALTNANFILNHFFARAPYLLDSGFYSALVYKAGLSPQNPDIALNWEPNYFAFHFSPYVVALSGLSYVQPLPRIEWYALTQAVVFAPIGACTYMVARKLDPAGALRRLPLTALTALIFSFCGLVISFVGYPHYEPAIPPLTCITLVFATTGNLRWTWVFLVLAASVREDAGGHTAAAMLPLLYLRWRGIGNLPFTVRQYLVLIGGAFAMTVVMVAIQKVFFASTTLNHIYLGSPPLAHVNLDMIGDRIQIFVDYCHHIYYPFLATVLVSILLRDVNYVLGWVVTGPWFLLNLLAYQQVKASMFAYAAIPFLVSIFWVFLYGALIAPPARRLRPVAITAVFALVSFSSTLGLWRLGSHATKTMLVELFHRAKWNRDEVHAFVDSIGKRTPEWGRFKVDYAVASLALEHVRYENYFHVGHSADADSFAFHRGAWGSHLLNDLVRNELDFCRRIQPTKLLLCSKEKLPDGQFARGKTDTIPAALAYSVLNRTGVTVEHDRIVMRDARVEGRLTGLEEGSYTIEVDVDAGPGVPAKFADFEVQRSNTYPLIVEAPDANGRMSLGFTIAPQQDAKFFVRSLLATPVAIKRITLRRVTPPAR